MSFEVDLPKTNLPRRTYPGKGARAKPNLNADDIERFLDVCKRTTVAPQLPQPGFWLIYRLIIEHDLKLREIVGTRYVPNRPGIQYDDLEDDSIWIHSKNPGQKRFHFHGSRMGKKDYIRVPVSSDLLREIRRFAEKHHLRGRLFDIGQSSLQKLSRKFAKEARITQYDLVNPWVLRNAFQKYPSSSQIDLGAFESKMLRRGDRMAQYYKASFCIERGLRELVSERMEQTYHENWWENEVNEYTREQVKKTQADELSTLMFARSSDPLEYTTFTELKVIVDKHPSVFSTDFSRGLDKMGDVFETLNQLRHVIAHNSEFTDEQKKKFDVMMDDWRAMQPK